MQTPANKKYYSKEEKRKRNEPTHASMQDDLRSLPNVKRIIILTRANFIIKLIINDRR